MPATKIEVATRAIMTRIVDSSTSCFAGHVHLAISSMAVLMNDLIPAASFVMMRRPFSVFLSWQGLRASNSRPAVLETAALPTELNPCIFLIQVFRNHSGNRLLGFLMNRVFAVELTVFFLFEPAWSISFLLGGRVISMLAFGAFQCDYLTHIKLRYRNSECGVTALRIFRNFSLITSEFRQRVRKQPCGRLRG